MAEQVGFGGGPEGNVGLAGDDPFAKFDFGALEQQMWGESGGPDEKAVVLDIFDGILTVEPAPEEGPPRTVEDAASEFVTFMSNPAVLRIQGITAEAIARYEAFCAAHGHDSALGISALEGLGNISADQEANHNDHDHDHSAHTEEDDDEEESDERRRGSNGQAVRRTTQRASASRNAGFLSLYLLGSER